MLNVSGTDDAHAGPPGSNAVPAEYVETLTRAINIIKDRIVGKYQSDKIFRSLPKGKSFKELFDSDIWVNYDPSNKEGNFGWTIPETFPNDVVITRFALRMGRWSTAGTIVHEMAHLDGADGNSHAAENTLRFCGLKSPAGPYDPSIRG